MPLRRSSLAAVFLAIAGCVRGAGFDPETGLPLVRNFSPEAYRGHNQVFASVRGPDGVMHFGTYGAVVSFDGERWRRLDVPGTWIRALATGPDGRVYVGGGGLLGRIEAGGDASGPRFVSLAAKLPPATAFTSVWSAVAADDAVFFALDGAVVAWRDDAFRVWPFPDLRPAVRRAGEGVYCHAGDRLLRWDGADWRPWVRDDRLGAARRLTLLPAGAADVLVALDNGTLLRAAADGTLAPWRTPAEAFLRRAGVRNGVRLPDGGYVLSTANEGLVFLDRDGEPLRRLGAAAGLAHAATYGLTLDGPDRLWVETANGLSVFDPGAAWSLFDVRNGRPDGIGGELRRFGTELVLTPGDVAPLRLVPAADAFGAARFEPLQPGLDSRATVTFAVRGVLHCGTERGIIRVGATPTLAHATASPVEFCLVPPGLPDVLVAGLLRGVELLRIAADGSLQEIARVTDFGYEVTNIVAGGPRELWVGTTSGVALRLRLHPDGAPADTLRFDAGRGLPAGAGWVKVHGTPAGALVVVRDGVFRPDATGLRLEADARFAGHRPAGINTLPIESDAEGRFWFQIRRPDGEFEPGCLDLRAGPPRWEPLPAELAGPLGFGGLRSINLHREHGREWLWLAGTRATVRLDLGAPPAATPPPDALIVGLQQGTEVSAPAAGPLHLPYRREPVRIQFASPAAANAVIGYETRLLGYHPQWTKASAPEVTYTNLTGGPFTLEVRARDARGRTGRVAQVTFQVAPPWHRSPGAFAAYALGLAGAVAGFVRWRVGRAEREQRRLEALVATRTAELAAARDQAEAANRAKSAFLAAMSHELRTPLNGVIGYAQILESDRRLAPDQRERVQIVRDSGEHLLRMINDVLDLAKIEAGRIEVRPERFALASFLHEVAASHAPAAARKGLAFAVDAAADLPSGVRGDPQKLRQVLDNLLGNALKFTAGGRVSLRVRRAAGDGITFAVEDTGPGIAPADQARLFQPFEQVRTNGDVQGTGLGLAISRQLVERLGGRLTLASAPGAGSAFAFTVPLPADAPPAASAGEVRIAGHDGPVRRVLVVDDQAVNRQVVVELLTPLGFACEAAASANAALARLQPADVPWPDLLIVDVRMAGLDGLELARRVRALRPGSAVRILLMSASVLSFDPRAGREAGADDFLAKPFRAPDLLAKVGQLLGLRWREEPAAPPPPVPSELPPLPAGPAVQLRELLAQGDLAAFRQAVAAARAAHPAAVARWQALDDAAAGLQLPRLRQLLAEP